LTISSDYFGAYGREYWVTDEQGTGLLPPVWCMEIGEPPDAELHLQGDVTVLITTLNYAELDRWKDAGWGLVNPGDKASTECALSFLKDGMAQGSCTGQMITIPLIEGQVVQVYQDDQIKVYDGETLIQDAAYQITPSGNEIGGGR